MDWKVILRSTVEVIEFVVGGTFCHKVGSLMLTAMSRSKRGRKRGDWICRRRHISSSGCVPKMLTAMSWEQGAEDGEGQRRLCGELRIAMSLKAGGKWRSELWVCVDRRDRNQLWSSNLEMGPVCVDVKSKGWRVVEILRIDLHRCVSHGQGNVHNL
jgi:hypothetical protein